MILHKKIITYQHESQYDSQRRDYLVAESGGQRRQQSEEARDQHAVAEDPLGADDLSEPAAR